MASIAVFHPATYSSMYASWFANYSKKYIATGGRSTPAAHGASAPNPHRTPTHPSAPHTRARARLRRRAPLPLPHFRLSAPRLPARSFTPLVHAMLTFGVLGYSIEYLYLSQYHAAHESGRSPPPSLRQGTAVRAAQGRARRAPSPSRALRGNGRGGGLGLLGPCADERR